MEIEDSAWKNPKKIKSVSVNYEEESYLIDVEQEELEDEKYFQIESEMYESHGWKVLGKTDNHE